MVAPPLRDSANHGTQRPGFVVAHNPGKEHDSRCIRDDGVFQDEQQKIKTMLVQVKGGHTGAKDIRDFVGTLSRENAEMGVFLTLQAPTKPMRTEAASAGMYHSPWDEQEYPRVQILTVEELIQDPHCPNPSCLQLPRSGGTQHTLPEAPKHRKKTHKQAKLFEGEN
ncbi:MAG: restriction endonuclease [Phycisphaerae bacterium]|nr:restriction endonuclease [Phycisphaerae bacterium]